MRPRRPTIPTQTAKHLTRILREIPDEVMFDSTWRVQFNQVFAKVLDLRGVSSKDGKIDLQELWGPHAPNLSSFQRAVAKEAALRRKRLDLQPLTRRTAPATVGESSEESLGDESSSEEED